MDQVRIVSDGYPRDTHVTRVSDGKEIPGVTDVSIFLSTSDELARASIDVVLPVADVKTVPTFTFTCPCCEETLEHACNESQTLGGRRK